MEMLGQFQVGASAFGFKFFKGATGEATIKYVPSSNELVIDFTQLRRLVNDNGVYDGIYRAVLPERLAEGSEMKMLTSSLMTVGQHPSGYSRLKLMLMVLRFSLRVERCMPPPSMRGY